MEGNTPSPFEKGMHILTQKLLKLWIKIKHLWLYYLFVIFGTTIFGLQGPLIKVVYTPR